MGKNLTFVGLYIANALGGSIYSVLPPYLPKEAEDKDLSSTTTGIILCGYPVTAFLSSFILANYISRIGKKRVLLIGCFFEFVSTLGYSFLTEFDATSFVVYGIVLRLVQGMGAGFMGVAIFAIIASEYADQLQSYLGALQTSNAIGFMAGPFGASLLYSINGFSLIFQVYGVIFFLMLPFICYTIPKDSKYTPTESPLSSVDIMKKLAIWHYLIAIILSLTTMCYLSPTYSLHLEHMDVPESMFGIIFGLPTVTYALTIGLVTKIKASRSSMMLAGLIILTISCFIVGPWEGTGLPENVFVSVSGMLLIGIGICAVQLTGIPEFIEKSQGIFSEYTKEQVSDVCSGIASSLAYFAELFAPPLSGVLADSVGFSDSEAILGAGFIVLTGLIWLVIRREKPVATKKEKLLPDLELGNV